MRFSLSAVLSKSHTSVNAFYLFIQNYKYLSFKFLVHTFTNWQQIIFSILIVYLSLLFHVLCIFFGPIFRFHT